MMNVGTFRIGRIAALVVAVATLVAAVLSISSRRAAAGAENWNDDGIHWMSYDEGLAAAKKEHRPICLIFYTTWCPHCAHYSTLFSNPEIVKKSQSFVMIHLDKDKNAALSAQYKPDGEYIPRTFFLSADGKLDESLTEDRPQFKYFYSESDPASIVAGMDRALKKFKQ